ncbi:MAG: formate C-acetyltransferase/glycerol dehydratase family glycyl radical enzyme [Dehalococcoidia bacterium]
MPFPYRHPKQAEPFALAYFERLRGSDDLYRTWLGLDALIQVRIQEPDIAVFIDTRGGSEMRVRAGVSAEEPDLTLTLTADTFHDIYTGRLNVFPAFATRKITTEGNVALIMKTAWTLPQAIQIYREHCASAGLAEQETKAPTPEATEVVAAASTGDRVERLRERFLRGQREVCVERARYLTASYRQTEGQLAVLRQARALEHVLGHISVRIEPDELLVGNVTGKPLGAGIYPEGVAGRILGELPNLAQRDCNTFAIAPDDERELVESILPYWRGKTIEDRARELWSPQVTANFEKVAPFILTEIGGIGHMLFNHQRVLERGLLAIIEEASGKRQEAKDKAQRDFYEAAEIAGRAVVSWANRYADEAQRLADTATDPRRDELLAIAEACRRVPAQPPRTFQEALQSVLFMHYVTQIESWESAISLGRMDQFLYPAYRDEVEAGQLSRERALELLACFYIKLSHSIPLFDADVTLAFSGLTNFANTVIGGVDGEGNDVTNDLSYLMLEAMKRVRTPQPNFGVRLHKQAPREFRDAVVQAVADGIGNLQLFNDEVVIDSLTNRGVPLQEARDYGIIGCVEQAVPGKSFTSSDAALLNLPLCLELALNNGRGRLFSDQLGLPTRDPRSFTCIEDVVEAYRAQVEHLVGQMVEGLEGLAQAHAERRPVPLASSLTDDCLTRGLDLTAGGARYNFTGVQGVGVATVADSLAAIDSLVFEQKRITMGELLAALDTDFEGRESLRQMLLNKAPKYGNDDDHADRFARLAAEIYCRAVEKHRNLRGGSHSPGLYSVTTHVAFGLMVGATPDGRRASEPLSQGISPAHGRDRRGPTAALKSAAKLDHTLVSNGLALIQMLSLGASARKHANDVLGGLLEAYFALGGQELQWNLVDRATLLAAQQDPEAYRGLVVRVAGYSALFTDLNRVVQDELIARTEHTV